jgi:hypothetical protein
MFSRGFDADERIEQHVIFTEENWEFDFTGCRAWKRTMGVKKEVPREL